MKTAKFHLDAELGTVTNKIGTPLIVLKSLYAGEPHTVVRKPSATRVGSTVLGEDVDSGDSSQDGVPLVPHGLEDSDCFKIRAWRSMFEIESSIFWKVTKFNLDHFVECLAVKNEYRRQMTTREDAMGTTKVCVERCCERGVM